MPRKDFFLLRHTTLIGTITLILCLALTTSMLYRQQGMLGHSRVWMLHTYDVANHLERLERLTKNAQLAEQRYLITGDVAVLPAYTMASGDNFHTKFPAGIAGQVYANITGLRKLTSDNPAQSSNIDQIDSALHTIFAYLSSSLRQRDLAGIPVAVAQPADVTDALANLDLLIATMRVEENKLMSSRADADEKANRESNELTFLAVVLFYAGMLLLLLLAIRETHRAQKLEGEAERASAQLNASRLFLKNIINHVPDPIFVKDRQHRWTLGNTAMWELFGKGEEELLGKTDYDFFPKSEADVFQAKDLEVFTSGKDNINTEKFTDAQGITHTISTRKACFDNGGEPTLVGVIRDVTELTRLQEKLKQRDEERVKSIMDHAERALTIKDREGRYLQVNKPFLAVLGRSEEEVIGKTDADFYDETYAKISHENEQAVFTLAKAIEYEEVIAQTDGKRTYRTVKFPLYDASDSIYAICGMSTDITARKATEAELLRYTLELERSNQELGDFAYIASHDLKEPLRGLFNHASFLMEDYGDKLDEDGVRRLNRLAQLAQRMERLVNDLLYFSRLGRGEMAIQKADLNEVLEDIEQMLESFLKEHHASIIIPAPLPQIICDQTRVTEVFRNLITNAVKYNNAQEKIVEVGFHAEFKSPQGLEKNVFYIKDNGIGIEPEFHEQIFRIFKRLQPAGNGETGTGVGLTFVKKIIERHKGRIWLESSSGQGTIFYFTLGKTFHEA